MKWRVCCFVSCDQLPVQMNEGHRNRIITSWEENGIFFAVKGSQTASEGNRLRKIQTHPQWQLGQKLLLARVTSLSGVGSAARSCTRLWRESSSLSKWQRRSSCFLNAGGFSRETPTRQFRFHDVTSFQYRHAPLGGIKTHARTQTDTNIWGALFELLVMRSRTLRLVIRAYLTFPSREYV